GGGSLAPREAPCAARGAGQPRRGLEMVERVRARGIGVILITHVMAQAFAVADRIVVLRHGIVAGDVATSATSPDEVVRMITGGIERIGRGRSTQSETGAEP
ncbi:MAG TPA: sugar ABC transporter ATP-binding protein, partial [Bauldia sp.]|nr:sugar ABC transporter ATP-binding protein [Bauldia sp.]